MPSGVNEGSTTIVNDDGFFDCAGRGVIVVGDAEGYVSLKPPYDFEPFITVTAQVLCPIKFLYEEETILLSGIKKLYECYGIIKSIIKLPYDEQLGVKSNVKVLHGQETNILSNLKRKFEETASLKGSIKYTFEESAELKSDIIFFFEEVVKLQPDLSLEEFSEWIKGLIIDRKLLEIGKINREIEMIDEQLDILRGAKIKTGEQLTKISQLEGHISRLEDEKKRIKKKLKIKKILRVLKALEEI